MITSCYNLGEGENAIDEDLVEDFSHNSRDFLNISYKLGKHFKTMPSNEFPTSSLKLPYYYALAMLCRFHEEPDAQKFKISWVPLLYYVTSLESSLTCAYILPSTLEQGLVEQITRLQENSPSFTCHHM
jgi:hypothetical protein